jgi:hypothetical protein
MREKMENYSIASVRRECNHRRTAVNTGHHPHIPATMINPNTNAIARDNSGIGTAATAAGAPDLHVF